MDRLPVPLDRVVEAIRAHPAVDVLTLFGSQKDGGATPLSDWDFGIESSDDERVFIELPTVVSTFEPLAAFWDPLGHRRNFMAIFPGPVKIDLHIDMPPLATRPWDVSRETIRAIDVHFWDWTLWLAGKHLNGKHGLVQDELTKMYDFLLAPIGCERPPQRIDDAIAMYLEARTGAETDHGTAVADNPLEKEVRAALGRHGFFAR